VVIGGSGSGYVWALAAGTSLPAGIGISNSGSPRMTGTPTVAGTFAFTLEVSDSVANVETRTFNVETFSVVSDFHSRALTDNSVFLIEVGSTMSGARITAMRTELVAALAMVPSSWSIDVVVYGSQFSVANNFNAKCFGSLTKMTAARKWDLIRFIQGPTLNPGGGNSLYSTLQDITNTYPTGLQSLFITTATTPDSASSILATGWFVGYANLALHCFAYVGSGSAQTFMQQFAAMHGGTYTAI
jgi:hypothetical protein